MALYLSLTFAHPNIECFEWIEKFNLDCVLINRRCQSSPFSIFNQLKFLQPYQIPIERGRHSLETATV